LKIAKRLALVVMGLFPALWGLLGGLNNLTDFSGTAEHAVRPIIAMTSTYGNPLQSWRAISAPWAAPVGLVLITTMETATGIFSLVGVLVMLANIRGASADFAKGKAWMILGCLCAILVWGVGFLVVAGDWFLAWQAKDPLAVQGGAMIYFLPCALALIVAITHREEG
jgi:predicted small integral membrane protein